MYVYEYSPLSLAILCTPTTLTLCKDLELWGVMPGSVLDAQCTWSLHLRIAPRVFYFSAILIHALSGRCGQIGVGTPKRNDFDFTLLVALLHHNMEQF